jgi:cell pole-organizing protein PopZ
MSADQAAILESIRDIIAGNPPEVSAPADDDVLVLTQMVNDDGSVTEIKPKSKKKEAKKEEKPAEPVIEKVVEKKPGPVAEPAPEPKSSSNDILSELDALLNENVEEKPDSAPTIQTKEEDIFIELAEIDKKQAELEKTIAPEPSIVLPQEPETKSEPIPEPKIETPAFEPVEDFAPINLKEEVKTMTEEVVSETSISAAKSSIASLMSKLDETKKGAPAFKSGETVEDIVAQMLKPMMKDWLDNNLPKLVNQIVEREIAKIMSSK